jgi:hypothetical protein
MHGNICRGEWEPPPLCCLLWFAQISIPFTRGASAVFCPVTFNAHQSALTLWGQLLPISRHPRGLELRTHNTPNGILKIPICLADPINKCEPFHPLCKRDASPPGFKRSVRCGFLRVTASKHPAVTVLSQDKDYALTHAILWPQGSFKFSLPTSLQQNVPVSETWGAFLKLSLVKWLVLKEPLFRQ